MLSDRSRTTDLCWLLAVETPILDGLGDVRGADLLGAGEVGDGACDLEHAGVRARREAELRHGALDEHGTGRIGAGEGIELAGVHVRVAAGYAEARVLALAGGCDARCHGHRRLATRCAAELAVLYRCDLDVQVDAVEQGPRQARVVLRELSRGAATPA